MDFQLLSAIVFVVVLAVLLYFFRSKLTLHKVFFPLIYILMYKSRLGLGFMDALGRKHARLMQVLGLIAIFVGFIGMVFIAFVLVENLLKILTVPETVAGVQLVLPVKIKGTFYVPFFYWILSIIAIAAVHEFAHGIAARSYGMKIKSSGIAFVGLVVPIIPAAFVEPDEKEIIRRPKRQQLAVYSAGPFANVLLGILALLILLAATPLANSMFEDVGVEVASLAQGDIIYPAEAAGIKSGEIIKAIDGQPTLTRQDFIDAMDSKLPGDFVDVQTDRSSYTFTLAKNPDDKSKPYLGVFVQQKTVVRQSVEESVGGFIPAVIVWLFGLLYWIYLLSIGIGLFNLLPVGPLDGGRMLLTAFQKFLSKDKAMKYWKVVSMFFFVLIMTNIVFSFF